MPPIYQAFDFLMPLSNLTPDRNKGYTAPIIFCKAGLYVFDASSNLPEKQSWLIWGTEEIYADF